jgi:hypothetical protein
MTDFQPIYSHSADVLGLAVLVAVMLGAYVLSGVMLGTWLCGRGGA